jgi:hypothetical protein
LRARSIKGFLTGKKDNLSSGARLWRWPLGALVSLLVFGSVVAETPTAVEAELVTIEAVVEAVDLEQRLVTLRGPEGNTRVIEVDEQARNLDQVEVGDRVIIEYFESIALMLDGPGTGAGAEISEVVQVGPKGEKPTVKAVDTLDVTAVVEAIDRDARSVTLKGPKGNFLILEVGEDAPNFDRIKVGDEVTARYTEAMAIAVRKPE